MANKADMTNQNVIWSNFLKFAEKATKEEIIEAIKENIGKFEKGAE